MFPFNPVGHEFRQSTLKKLILHNKCENIVELHSLNDEEIARIDNYIELYPETPTIKAIQDELRNVLAARILAKRPTPRFTPEGVRKMQEKAKQLGLEVFAD